MIQHLVRASVVGLGRLGAPLLACLGGRGFTAVGVDIDPGRVAAINARRSPVREPGVEELLAAAGERVWATADVGQAVAATEVTFLVVPTPSDADGRFCLDAVSAAATAVGQALAAKNDFHLIVVTSTVMPGATGGELLPLLERTSGKRCGAGFGLCYSPEFIALGSVVRDLLAPDFVLIGESDAGSGALLADLYGRLTVNHAAVRRMGFVNAELTKLALNTYVTTKISFANMLAGLCEALPGAEVDVVTGAIGLDHRVGGRYLRGGTAYGGPCFPRDNAALVALARGLGRPAWLAEATDRVNRHEAQRLLDLVLSKRPPGGTVAVLGLSYKPGSEVVEASAGLLLARDLAARGLPVTVWDPQALAAARAALGTGVAYADSLTAAVAAADVVVLTTPWPELAGLTGQALARDGRRRVLIDCWRLLDHADVRAAVDYVALGLAPAVTAEVDGLTLVAAAMG